MTTERAKAELEQIYGILSSEKQQALDKLFEVAEHRKKAYWKKVIDDKGYIDGNPCTFYHYECSICGTMNGNFDINKFCPNCGARMESEHETDN